MVLGCRRTASLSIDTPNPDFENTQSQEKEIGMRKNGAFIKHENQVVPHPYYVKSV